MYIVVLVIMSIFLFQARLPLLSCQWIELSFPLHQFMNKTTSQYDASLALSSLDTNVHHEFCCGLSNTSLFRTCWFYKPRHKLRCMFCTCQKLVDCSLLGTLTAYTRKNLQAKNKKLAWKLCQVWVTFTNNNFVSHNTTDTLGVSLYYMCIWKNIRMCVTAFGTCTKEKKNKVSHQKRISKPHFRGWNRGF